MFDQFMSWFGKLCTPLKVFLVLGAISVALLLFSADIGMALGKAAFVLLGFLLFRWMCSKGWNTAVWVLVLLPYILTALFLVWAMYEAAKGVGDAMDLFSKWWNAFVSQKDALKQKGKDMMSGAAY